MLDIIGEVFDEKILKLTEKKKSYQSLSKSHPEYSDSLMKKIDKEITDLIEKKENIASYNDFIGSLSNEKIREYTEHYDWDKQAQCCQSLVNHLCSLCEKDKYDSAIMYLDNLMLRNNRELASDIKQSKTEVEAK